MCSYKERFTALAMSQGGLQTILKVRPELIEKDLDEFLNVMRNIKGKNICSFCYRMRIGVK